MLEQENPGSKTNVQLDALHRFEYLFVALGASIEGFQWMRKVIVVDATFLKTVYGGQLVFATAQDPNHHHYPIAFGIIDSENHSSWPWFLENLKAVVPDDPELVFVSDRHKSIIYGVSKVYPLARHVHCIWHLAQNVKGHAQQGVKKDDVVDKFIKCAHAYTGSEFKKEFDEFRKLYPACAKFLVDKIDVERWARCIFEGEKYNLDTSNSCESMNSVFRKDRKLSLLPMLDKIIEKFAFWSNKYRNECASMPSTKVVVPFVENVLHERCPIAKRLTVREVNGQEFLFDVFGSDGVVCLVDLASKTCVCRMFDIDKYPCVHAIAALMAKIKKDGRMSTLSVYDLCSRYYLVETWARAYVKTIYTVPHISTWAIPEDVLKLFAYPPDYTAKRGRNQEERHPSEGESRKKKKKKTSNKCKPHQDLGVFF
ncbi:unnamed protein product [Microthlaspi erraticum]|uniref:SWIM-type domain-containing protein n=1 Tax=Microthlaspi erraticum TaxID=1685480 RepID=A0A6D2KU70_9BRAS|nr:unnamed protein product [Microthlaspi erraticum]